VVDSQKSWSELASSSLLLKAVSSWRKDPESWLEGSFERLPETVRVNPLRTDSKWVEEWITEQGGKPVPWFKGPGTAWEMPFSRGLAEGKAREMLIALHETGRITRQETVSMIPVLALEVSKGDYVLDMCASPGSKTTQISECLGEGGVVFANEISNSRANTLVSNVHRHGSKSAVIINHDGRHLPNMPNHGFDKVLVDAPCTGSATTRKNPEVWQKWTPEGGRSLHDLQIELLRKAVRLTRPGGRIVYSTCSLDPVENEAVVAEVIRSDPDIELIPVSEILPELPGRRGFQSWDSLDSDANPSTDIILKDSMLPPKEKRVSESLANCMRIWNDDIGGGGFFISVMQKSQDASTGLVDVESVKRSDSVKPDIPSSPQPIDKSLSKTIEQKWGAVPDELWLRGKKVLWANPEARSVWSSGRTIRNGKVAIPGGRWRPLRVVHLGMELARIRNGQIDRVVGKACQEFSKILSTGVTDISGDLLDNLLLRKSLTKEEIGISSDISGGHILVSGTDAIPVWVGERVTLMVNDKEVMIRMSQRGLGTDIG
jgi:NOL1/NOP2/sun family putative RNA methylase|tara:strand:- start:420 stop:2054 length:1635 start_codon:yes stop_codon:yes gene_type:complete